jgi:hypothetical protein
MAKLCEFGREIKKRLVDIDQNQTWLIAQVSADTGLYFDSSYMYKVLTGKLKTPKIVESIRKILKIEEAPVKSEA